MNFIQSIPYKLGSPLHKCNTNVEFIKTLKNDTEFYRSYKYSEVYLFGKSFESVCYLWFKDEILIRIEYRFHNKYFELFLNSINEELQQGNKLTKDPFVAHMSYFTSFGDIAIGLDELAKDHFLFQYWFYKEFNKTVTIKE